VVDPGGSVDLSHPQTSVMTHRTIETEDMAIPELLPPWCSHHQTPHSIAPSWGTTMCPEWNHGQWIEGEHENLCGTDRGTSFNRQQSTWIPIPDGIESMMLSLEMDPNHGKKLWLHMMWLNGQKAERKMDFYRLKVLLHPKSSVTQGLLNHRSKGHTSTEA